MRHHEGSTVRQDGWFERQIFDFGFEVLFALIAIGAQVLFEVTVRVVETDANERNAQSAGAFHVIARKNAEAAGVDGQGFMQTKFGRKIGDRFGTEDAGIVLSPCVFVFEIFLQAVERRSSLGCEAPFHRPESRVVPE